jgi:PhnB protein
MSAKVKPIPEGSHTITPHLVVRDAARAIDFYKRAFGAEELARMPGPGGKIMHAELRIGDSNLYLCDEFPDMGGKSPQSLNGSPVTLHLYVPDVDVSYKRAADAGAKPVMVPDNTFWGDRYGKLIDPFGHHWALATHVEDVTPEETARRAAAAFGGGQP